MSFDWAEYLSLAEDLCAVPISGPPHGSEARQRAAVSRAYYSAFILARNHLRDIDGIRIPPQVNAHQFVGALYLNDPDPVRQGIGDTLIRLRRVRNRCDYDDAVPNLLNLTSVSLSWSAQIIADLARL
jgi:hypothetical protein